MFVSLDEKNPQREMFSNVDEVKQKTAETLKGIKINEFKTVLSSGKKSLNRCITSNGEYFEGD